MKVFTIDTDFLFAEAAALRQKFVEKYPIELTVLKGEVALAEQERRLGLNLWQRDTDQCCALRKVEPTQTRAARALDAWIAGLPARPVRKDPRRHRRRSSCTIARRRAASREGQTSAARLDARKRHLGLSAWRNQVPYSPLLDQGYKSIGCWPCTRPVAADADERAGRWGGQKAECGIHTFMARK